MLWKFGLILYLGKKEICFLSLTIISCRYEALEVDLHTLLTLAQDEGETSALYPDPCREIQITE
jgi:hypothetical protein